MHFFFTSPLLMTVRNYMILTREGFHLVMKTSKVGKKFLFFQKCG